MANIKFVATQVLEPGEDGLSFKTSQLESEEEHKARLAKERAAQGKTLFEQLAENKEKAQQDYDAVTKQIFAPPKALDEDEVAFLEGVAAHEKAVEKRKAEEEAKELAAFAAARASQVKSAPVSVVARVELGGPATEKNSAFPEVKLKVKRKGEKGGAKEGVKKAKKEDGGAKKGDGEAKAKQEGEKKPAAAPATAMASLVAYGSDDDDEEEEE